MGFSICGYIRNVLIVNSVNLLLIVVFIKDDPWDN